MHGSSVALDTNQVVALMNGASSVTQLTAGFSSLCLPVTVLGELRFGFLNSRDAIHNLNRLDRFVSTCRILDARSTTADIYATVRLELKRKGRPIPENDLWIAAECIEHALPLITADAHFSAISSLHVISV